MVKRCLGVEPDSDPVVLWDRMERDRFIMLVSWCVYAKRRRVLSINIREVSKLSRRVMFDIKDRPEARKEQQKAGATCR